MLLASKVVSSACVFITFFGPMVIVPSLGNFEALADLVLDRAVLDANREVRGEPVLIVERPALKGLEGAVLSGFIGAVQERAAELGIDCRVMPPRFRRDKDEG